MLPIVVSLEEDGDEADDLNELSLPPRPSKAPRREKVSRPIVDSLHLSCLVASYNVHFAKYCKGRKQVTQLVPSLVWKEVFKEYKEHYTNSPFVEETLKARLRETLKEIKTGTSNDDNSNKATLQCDEVLEQLKCTDGHAARNVLKRRQSIIDRCSPNTSSGDLECLTPVSPGAQDSSRGVRGSLPINVKTPIEKPLTKAEMLSAQSRSFVAITNHLTNRNKRKEELLIAEAEERRTKAQANLARIESEKLKGEFVEEKRISQKVKNLEKARDLGVISEETFKLRVANLLIL
jgi:hypothetical protein